jgi:hypothetical protein
MAGVVELHARRSTLQSRGPRSEKPREGRSQGPGPRGELPRLIRRESVARWWMAVRWVLMNNVHTTQQVSTRSSGIEITPYGGISRAVRQINGNMIQYSIFYLLDRSNTLLPLYSINVDD